MYYWKHFIRSPHLLSLPTTILLSLFEQDKTTMGAPWVREASVAWV